MIGNLIRLSAYPLLPLTLHFLFQCALYTSAWIFGLATDDSEELDEVRSRLAGMLCFAAFSFLLFLCSFPANQKVVSASVVRIRTLAALLFVSKVNEGGGGGGGGGGGVASSLGQSRQKNPPLSTAARP